MKTFFKKHKIKIITVAAAAVVLAVSFFVPSKKDTAPNPAPTVTATAVPSVSPSLAPTPIVTASAVPSAAPSLTPSPAPTPAAPPKEQTFTAPKQEKKSVCTLTVRCDEILKNIDKLNPEKRELIPENGIIYSGKAEINDGESVFDVLQREMRKNKIHMEFVNTPATNSAYVKGINNIYEFDCDGFSGWTYFVNGKTPNVGCSQCFVKDGDIVEWKYVCEITFDMGD